MLCLFDTYWHTMPTNKRIKYQIKMSSKKYNTYYMLSMLVDEREEKNFILGH